MLESWLVVEGRKGFSSDIHDQTLFILFLLYIPPAYYTDIINRHKKAPFHFGLL